MALLRSLGVIITHLQPFYNVLPAESLSVSLYRNDKNFFLVPLNIASIVLFPFYLGHLVLSGSKILYFIILYLVFTQDIRFYFQKGWWSSTPIFERKLLKTRGTFFRIKLLFNSNLEMTIRHQWRLGPTPSSLLLP